MKLLEHCHFVQGVTSSNQAAGEDMYNGGIAGDVVSMKNAKSAVWIVQQLAGETGRASIYIAACDDASATNSANVSFLYKRITSGDTHGTTTETKELATTAGADQMYVIEVDAAKLAEQGYEFVQMVVTEKTNNPVDGTIVGPILCGLRSAEDALGTQLS